MKKNSYIIFLILAILTIVLFFADLVFGSIRIPVQDILSVFTGNKKDIITSEIILNLRIPKAITAVLTGSSLAVAGLMMQTLFRNPLADPYILGVSSGASLGVAITIMATSILPIAFTHNGWLLIISATIGALLVLLLVIAVSFRVRNAVSLLIVGIMFGMIAGSLVNVLQNFSNPDSIKLFVMWTFGSLSAVTWEYMKILFPVVLIGLAMAFSLQKRLDGLLLGENYARSLGIPITATRVLIVIATGLLAGGVTAFVGPIAFVGIAIPHIARGLFRTANHRVLLPACVLCGSSLLLVCDLVSQIPTHHLPINTVSALFGAPIIIWIIMKRSH
ncbi:iron ABC transporter permease [Paludibacter sp. 221]|uniref:iron ABC transporter permease n=1 Tax=Paludibacter sp. 221 TaxID=2302939 RepID=UPI0013D6DDAE|nr:iron ABC transporter permease [Paludibacter sp. 221]NDV46437.1 iron ABC transporter permease [Paludibacter sp. 221]